jgi:hypothetical protein
MSDPLCSGGKTLLENESRTKSAKFIISKDNKLLLFASVTIVLGLILRIWQGQPVFYAHAYTGNEKESVKIQSPLFTEKTDIFAKDCNRSNGLAVSKLKLKKQNNEENDSPQQFAQKLYEVVGDAPIKEMIPFISRRNEKVAAFLVGIAKKESSLGFASPSKDGQDCYNYWGYKGSAGRGSSLGYACFASAEEAIEIVGNRIEVLINKNRTTPARMVDTWKCGVSCAGDAGAPGWVSTVALYFNKIVS